MSFQTIESKLAHIYGIDRKKRASAFPSNFSETLVRTAELHSDRGIQILDRTGRKADRRNYADVLERVQQAVGKWRTLGVRAGDRVLLCLPTSWDFIDAWLGAICIGAYPAAIASAMGGLSSSSNFAERLQRFRSVIGASRLLVGERMAEDLRDRYADTLGAIALAPQEFNAAEVGVKTFANAESGDLAFLQFTSGSTGTPRAVMIEHGMATHNAFAIDEGIGHRFGMPASEYIDLHSSWLPMHHDMGLIGCLLLSIANGLELSLMNPATFLARPIRYLETLSGKRAMMCGPNFGYQFCVDRLKREDIESLDLSKVAVAMTGSEMIHPETMDAFCDLMKPTGFTPDKVMPCYGMAEATLAVAFDGLGQGVRTAPVPQASDIMLENKEVVSCGVATPDTEIRISDSEGRTLNENELGEILIKGPAVFGGFYEDDEATTASKRREWLRTGDLGFIENGEVYVAGRYKEILVVRGENIMPHELEWLAEEARGEGEGGERSAAFSVAHGGAGEEIVLVVETNESDAEKLKDLEHAIRSRIGLAMSLPVSDLAFVRRGRIPRTSSGKIQRGKVKEQYIEDGFERINLDCN